MGSRWHQERRRDPYFRDAKKRGYRARSAFKLQQINNRHHLVRPGDAVVDLGCAPGGWSQVLVELVGPKGLVVGVDLQRTRPVEGAQFIQGDFTLPETRRRLEELLEASGRLQLDAVMSDMAPDMSGNYGLDQARSVYLCSLALDFAEAHLRPGGSFLCKVFEGADFHEFREDVRQRFRSIATSHPPASRKSSSEVYLLGRGYRGADEEE